MENNLKEAWQLIKEEELMKKMVKKTLNFDEIQTPLDMGLPSLDLLTTPIYFSKQGQT